MTGRSLALFSAVLFAGLLGLAPPAAAGEVGDAAVLATDSVHLNRSSELTGDVVANDAASDTLVPGFELVLERSVKVTGDVSADTIQREAQVMTGTIACNGGTGVSCNGLALPVFPALPPFQLADVRPEAADVTVAAGQTVSLPAGEYGDVRIAQTGTLVLQGGVYDLRSVSPITTAGGQCPYPCRSLLFAAPSDVRIVGRFDMSRDACVSPGTGQGDCPAQDRNAVGALSGATAILYVGGSNGGDGSANALPAAATVGRDSTLAATVYAPNGTVLLDQSTLATGAMLGRHVRLDKNAVLEGDSYFGNRPPVADPQDVRTLGAASIDITLTGSDPNGDSLSFSIDSGPSKGTLSGVTPNQADGQCSTTTSLVCEENADCPMSETCVLPPVTSARVTYTPTNPADEEEDSFDFRVTDPSGAFDSATVRINPPDDPTVVNGVSVAPVAVETLQDTPVTLELIGQAPIGCTLAFSIVVDPPSGPFNGTLGPVTQITPVSAQVTYTPNPGFFGNDSFVFRATTNVGGACVANPASATATASVGVGEGLAPTQADNQTVTTPFETPVEITLTGTPGSGGGLNLPGRLRGLGEAAFLEGSAIAGNVADSDRDGFGDNHNDLPGPAPVLMAAAVDATGGAGSNGILRMHIEWDISELSGLANELVSAEVLLNTEVGTIDSLDTFWYPGTADNDGLLTDSDFESEVDLQNNPLATMPVPDEPPGTEGTFSFDVLDALRLALQLDHQYFYVQGRVDESLDTNGEGPIQRGLQVRTSADGNLPDFLHPQLSLTTPGVVAPLAFTVTTLPKTALGQPIGTLKNSLGATISSVPAVLPDALLTFTPATAFEGVGSFQFQATDGVTVGTATVTLVVASGFGFGDCLLSEAFCAKGRSSAGGSGFAGSDTAADYALKVAVRGRGDVSSSPRQVKNGMPVGLFCAGAECVAHFPSREMVALFARPAEAGWVFAGWGGDCSGSEPMTLVRMSGDRKCTARFERDGALRKGTK